LFCSDDCRSWPREEKINNHGCWQLLSRNLFHVVWTNFFCNYSYVVHTEYIYFFFSSTMSDNLPERVQILCHMHIICITVLENRIICCQIFCDLLLKSAFEQIFNVMQLILVKIKWKYLIQKFHDICLSYYFKVSDVNFHWGTFSSWFWYTIWWTKLRNWWLDTHTMMALFDTNDFMSKCMLICRLNMS
jgi:hypothetical protein